MQTTVRVALVFLLIGAGVSLGCARTTREVYEPNTGTPISRTDTTGGLVTSVLRNKLQQTTVTGVGQWTGQSQNVAREAALAKAINDLAMKAGEVLAEADNRIFNDDACIMIRTRAANIVQGYEITNEKWDAQTKTYTLYIEQNAWRIVERLHAYYPLGRASSGHQAAAQS